MAAPAPRTTARATPGPGARSAASAPTDRVPGTIVFCHANGFPAGTYSRLFEVWRAAGWRVQAPQALGHDPQYPVTSGWPHLRDELIAFIESQAQGGPVVLVGHSMGGYLALLVASARPQLVGAVVLLDAPIVAGWRSPAFGLLKLTGLINRGGPGKASARRREHWPSRPAAREHFGAKPMFARWDAQVLDDYIHHGLVADDTRGGVQLAFRRDVETRIYNTLPHHLPALLRRHPVRCPVGFIAGRHSAENLQLGLGFGRQLAGERWKWMEGSHLFPMERPDETAAQVLAMLTSAEP